MSFRNAFVHGLYFLRVARELARHDALFWIGEIGAAPAGLKTLVLSATRFVRRRTGLPEDRGERLALALRTLGPAFIKLGQMLATRADLIGPDLARGLAALQDRMPPFPADEARAIIARDLGAPLEEMFAAFEDEAVAAASVAQVHRARTPDGRDVAVKILRPGIKVRFQRDLAAFAWLAAFAEARIPKARRLRPVAVVETIAESVANELDLRLEAAAASELRQAMAGEPGYRIPVIDWQRTGAHVLTLEWIDGVALTDRTALDRLACDRKALAATIVRVFLLQAMRDGFFHADLHQGNLFVESDGTLVALDFGIMGRLDMSSRRYLAEILHGFLERDYQRVADWHFSAGYVDSHHDPARFAQAMRAIAEPIFDRPVRRIEASRLLGQLFQTTEAFGMETQPQLLLLQRSMVMVEGLALHLDAKANMWELSRPVIEAFMREQLSPDLLLADRIRASVMALADLPDLMVRVTRLVAGLERRLGQDTAPCEPKEDGRMGGGRLLLAFAIGAAFMALLLLV